MIEDPSFVDVIKIKQEVVYNNNVNNGNGGGGESNSEMCNGIPVTNTKTDPKMGIHEINKLLSKEEGYKMVFTIF